MIQPYPVLSILDPRGGAPRIVYLGMGGVFSLIPLRALLAAGRQVAAVVLPGANTRWVPPETAGGELPLLSSPLRPDVRHEAWKQGIPVLEVGRLADEAALAAVASLRPDLICVACFPRILPAGWLALPELGCLNLHPSLLPAYRGPAPLFWQLRAGETATGVTVHYMNEGIDTGDIVAQAPVAYPEGASGLEVERLAAAACARLLVAALAAPSLPRRPQPAAGATYQPFPDEEDRGIPTTWTARRAFSFARGAADMAPFWLDLGGRRVWVEPAFALDPGGTLDEPYQRRGQTVRVRFEPGVVDFLLAPGAQ